MLGNATLQPERQFVGARDEVRLVAYAWPPSPTATPGTSALRMLPLPKRGPRGHVHLPARRSYPRDSHRGQQHLGRQ